MTLDTNPEFWKWLIRKQREKTIRDGEKFEPIPLYIELEKPNEQNLERPLENEGKPTPEKNSSIVDFCINDDTIISY